MARRWPHLLAALGFGLIVPLLAAPVPAQDAAQAPVLELRSTIVGDGEQPSVFFVLPWRDSAGPSVVDAPAPRWPAELFQPLTQERLEAELQWRAQASENAIKAPPSP